MVAEGVETQAQVNYLCSLGVSAERKRWMHFVVNINNVRGVIGKSFLKK